MRLVCEGKPVSCLVSKETHAALRTRATREGLSIAQIVAAIIADGLRASGASSDLEALSTARLEARQWQEAADHLNDDVASLRARLADMEAQTPNVENSKNCKLTAVLDTAQIRIARAYRSAGWKPSEIALEMGVDARSVASALKGRR